MAFLPHNESRVEDFIEKIASYIRPLFILALVSAAAVCIWRWIKGKALTIRFLRALVVLFSWCAAILFFVWGYIYSKEEKRRQDISQYHAVHCRNCKMMVVPTFMGDNLWLYRCERCRRSWKMAWSREIFFV
jgi:hypothetical protein